MRSLVFPFRLKQEPRDDRLSLIAGILAARAGLAAAVFMLAIRTDSLFSTIPTPPVAASEGGWSSSALLLLLALLALTYVLTFLTHRRIVRHKMPSTFWLGVTAFLDPLWLSIGYLVSGYAAVPFAPLLVLALFVHGVLLPTVPTFFLAAWGGALFVLAHSITDGGSNSVFSVQIQLALLVGVGITSAIIGNRLRAARRTVHGLTGAVEQLSSQHVAILDGLPVGICVLGRDRHLVYANAALGELVGCVGDEEHAVGILLEQAPELSRMVDDVLRLERFMGGEGESTLSNTHRQISWRVVRHALPALPLPSSSPLNAPLSAGRMFSSDDGKAAFDPVVVVIASDITDRRMAEEAQRRAEHMTHIAELSAGLAHELRNPLAAVRSAAEQLGEAERSDPMDRQLTKVLLREVDRLNGLLREFLEFARVGGGAIAEYDLADIVREAASLLRRPEFIERGIGCDLHLTSVRTRIESDLVYRIVSNLLLNAAQHTRDGGCVKVELKSQDGKFAIVRVIDQGPGIPEALRDRVFRPFFTTRPGGTGLGLAIAARSAALLGGCLELESPSADGAARGAVFRLTIPLQG